MVTTSKANSRGQCIERLFFFPGFAYVYFSALKGLLRGGVGGLSVRDMRQYLGYVADSRLERLGIAPVFTQRIRSHSWTSEMPRS